jgi:thioesterase domain-containing protein/acyl carrier protein
MQPVPIGVRGELFVGGDGLARGYLNDRELTAEKFIPNPLQPGAVLYRTGDFARYLSDGNIEFLGRIDHQVKIRGFRVELGEIETVLRVHPAVHECVVAVLNDAPNDKKIVAYVHSTNASAQVGELRAFLKERLPDYMVPSSFVFLDRFPLTANGKIDRKELLSSECTSPSAGRSYVTARTRTENVLVSIWCELLNVSQVGVYDNFFALGGHSLMAIRLISKVNSTLNVTLSVPELFQNPTIEQLAKVIDGRVPMGKRRTAVILMQEGKAGPPVYFIHAGPWEYQLAQSLGEARSVFGIESSWPLAWHKAAASNEISALPTMEQLVAPYAAALGAHTRSSPCVLAGFSFGGLMAFEAAHQFQSQGGEVEAVLMIDTRAKYPSLHQATWQILQMLAQGESVPLSRLFKRAGKAVNWWMLGQKEKMLSWPLVRVAEYQDTEQSGELSAFFDEEDMPMQWALIQRMYRKASKNYRPRRLDCRGILFRATPKEEGIVAALDGTLGWKNLFTVGLEIVPVAGGHLEMLQPPNNLTLARELNAAINRLQQSGASRPNINARESWREPLHLETRPAVSVDSIDRTG